MEKQTGWADLAGVPRNPDNAAPQFSRDNGMARRKILVRRRPKRRARLLASALLGGAVLASWPDAIWDGLPPSERPPRGERTELLHAELQKSAELGVRGIPSLVDALRSSSGQTREGARLVLLDQLDQWERLPSIEAAPRMAALAEALSRRMKQFEPRERRMAVQLAERMLSWRIESQAVDCAGLAAHCDAVLRAAASSKTRKNPTVAQTGSNTERFLSAAHRGRPAPPESTPDEVFAAVTRDRLVAGEQLEIPGGGLPLDAIVPPKSEDEPPAELPLATDAERLAADEAARARAARENANSEARIPSTVRTARPPKPLRQPSQVITRIAAELPEDDDDNASTISLMHQLHNPSATVVEQAEAKLKKLGFGPAQLELARQMTAESPLIRRQLAEALPRMPGIDPSIWLAWLSRDADPQVRLAALTMMATTGDPKVLKEVARIAREDTDPKVREQGERLSGGDASTSNKRRAADYDD